MSEQLIYGLHAVRALLANPHRKVQKLFINQERKDMRIAVIIAKADLAQIQVEKLTSQSMNQRFQFLSWPRG